MSSFVGHRVPGEVVRLRKEPIRVPLLLLGLWWLLRGLVRAVLAVCGSPVAVAVLTAVTLSWALWTLTGPLLVVAVWFLLVAVVAVVSWRWPAVFDRARSALRSRWRRWSIYRRKWAATMDMAQLNRYRHDGSQYAPVLLSVTSTRHVDVVRARMLAGHVVDDWADVGPRLLQTFGGIDYRVRAVPGRPHEVECWFLVNDPLEQVVQPLEQEVPVFLKNIPVGLCEDGSPYRLQLLGSHVLLVGATGSGKSSVLWAIVHALAPAIADGTVEVWAVDPKGGMELGAGAPLFAGFAHSDPEQFAQLLEDAVSVMRARQVRLRGVTRLHEPSQSEPLIVIMIDELAALVSYVGERDLKRRIDTALALLLSQGRAVGVTVVGAIQDPRKETLPQRGLFTVRICLRVTEEDQVHLVLGRDARDRGARCDEIPESMAGVGFVQVDGVAEPVRVRFCFVTDDDIRTLVGGWRPSLALVPGGPSGPPEAEELAA